MSDRVAATSGLTHGERTGSATYIWFTPTERGAMNTDTDAMPHNVHDHGDHGGMFVAKVSRRGAIGAFAAFGLGLLVACGDDDDSSVSTSSPSATGSPATTTSATTPTTATTQATVAATTAAAAGEYLDFPEETNGPFPADGSNDNGAGELANVLADTRIVRSDITANLDAQDNVFADGDGSQITDLGDSAAADIGTGLQATVAIAV